VPSADELARAGGGRAVPAGGSPGVRGGRAAQTRPAGAYDPRGLRPDRIMSGAAACNDFPPPETPLWRGVVTGRVRPSDDRHAAAGVAPAAGTAGPGDVGRAAVLGHAVEGRAGLDQRAGRTEAVIGAGGERVHHAEAGTIRPDAEDRARAGTAAAGRQAVERR